MTKLPDETVEHRLRMTEQLLSLALADKERLKTVLSLKDDRRDLIVETVPKTLFDRLKDERDIAIQELVMLRGVAGLPGEVELVQRVADGKGGMVERPANRDELIRLCDANGLIVLPKGQFFCGACGAPRTTESCKWCPLVGDNNGGGNHERTRIPTADVTRDPLLSR